MYDELIHQTVRTRNAKARLALLHRVEELFLSKAACGAGLLGNTSLFHATFGQELEPACTWQPQLHRLGTDGSSS